jgi:hypothetical protein
VRARGCGLMVRWRLVAEELAEAAEIYDYLWTPPAW